jgi:sulfide:quinone oxidoreductase
VNSTVQFLDARTLTTPAEAVWALGDVSATTLPNGKPLPKAAVLAQGQAQAVADGVARHLGADAPEPWFDGEGYCYVEIGAGVAAKGAGNFLLPTGPEITLNDPSTEFHQDKERDERDWIRRWSTTD